ncbi:MAG: mannose-1-phosphate guanyltransferase, partial [Verrucomicrobiota bacterium]
NSKDVKATIEAQFASLPKNSIDYALMEKAGRVLNIEASFDWDDVGSWISVAKYLKEDGEKNTSNCGGTSLDSSNNIVFSKEKTHIALLGVKDLIVVQTDDAVLIADRNQADQIKALVDKLPEDLL